MIDPHSSSTGAAWASTHGPHSIEPVPGSTGTEASGSITEISLASRVETPDDVAVLLAQYTAMTGDLGTLDAFVARLGEVTAEDVARVVELATA